jgi:hypothetical protein
MQRQCHRCYLWTRIRFMIHKLGNHTSSDFRSRSEILLMSLFFLNILCLGRVYVCVGGIELVSLYTIFPLDLELLLFFFCLFFFINTQQHQMFKKKRLIRSISEPIFFLELKKTKQTNISHRSKIQSTNR